MENKIDAQQVIAELNSVYAAQLAEANTTIATLRVQLKNSQTAVMNNQMANSQDVKED